MLPNNHNDQVMMALEIVLLHQRQEQLKKQEHSIQLLLQNFLNQMNQQQKLNNSPNSIALDCHHNPLMATTTTIVPNAINSALISSTMLQLQFPSPSPSSPSTSSSFAWSPAISPSSSSASMNHPHPHSPPQQSSSYFPPPSSSPLYGQQQQLYQCQWEDCTRVLADIDDFLQHVRFEHLEPIQKGIGGDIVCHWKNCARGKKPFSAIYLLLQHLRAHTGEKPYICNADGCNKHYSRLENLKTHQRKHTGERPYPCHHCGASFTNASDKTKHVDRVHGGKKRYLCPLVGCECAYTDPSSLRKHICSAHGQMEWHKYKNARQIARGNL